jgi:hypothetical protein
MCSGRESGLRVASGRRLSGMFRSGHALFLGGGGISRTGGALRPAGAAGRNRQCPAKGTEGLTWPQMALSCFEHLSKTSEDAWPDRVIAAM